MDCHSGIPKSEKGKPQPVWNRLDRSTVAESFRHYPRQSTKMGKAVYAHIIERRGMIVIVCRYISGFMGRIWAQREPAFGGMG